MLTLEQRVARLERSARRWRLGCLAAMGMLTIAVVGGAQSITPATHPADGGNLIATSLTVRSKPGGPQISLVADDKSATMQITTARAADTAFIRVDGDGANIFLAAQSDKGRPSASLGVDNQSGSLTVQDTAGKTRDFIPE